MLAASAFPQGDLSRPGTNTAKWRFQPEPKLSRGAVKKIAKTVGLLSFVFTVKQDGTPSDVKTVRSVDAEIDEAYRLALLKSLFWPATRDGAPIESQFWADVAFGGVHQTEK
jgi:hypothetical protein